MGIRRMLNRLLENRLPTFLLNVVIRLLSWWSLLLFLGIPLLIILNGDVWDGVSIYLIYLSIVAGVALGICSLHAFFRSCLKSSADTLKRVRGPGVAVGMLFFAPVLVSLTTDFLDLRLLSLVGYMLQAIIIAWILFVLAPSDIEK